MWIKIKSKNMIYLDLVNAVDALDIDLWMQIPDILALKLTVPIYNEEYFKYLDLQKELSKGV